MSNTASEDQVLAGEMEVYRDTPVSYGHVTWLRGQQLAIAISTAGPGNRKSTRVNLYVGKGLLGGPKFISLFGVSFGVNPRWPEQHEAIAQLIYANRLNTPTQLLEYLHELRDDRVAASQSFVWTPTFGIVIDRVERNAQRASTAAMSL